MNKILRYVFVALLAVASNASFAADAEPEVTLDFTSNDVWKLPTNNAKNKATFSNGTYTITLEAASSGYKFNDYKGSECLIFGSSAFLVGRHTSYSVLTVSSFMPNNSNLKYSSSL